MQISIIIRQQILIFSISKMDLILQRFASYSNVCWTTISSTRNPINTRWKSPVRQLTQIGFFFRSRWHQIKTWTLSVCSLKSVLCVNLNRKRNEMRHNKLMVYERYIIFVVLIRYLLLSVFGFCDFCFLHFYTVLPFRKFSGLLIFSFEFIIFMYGNSNNSSDYIYIPITYILFVIK